LRSFFSTSFTSALGGFGATDIFWTFWILGAAGGRGPGRIIGGADFGFCAIFGGVKRGAANRFARLFEARRFDLRDFKLDGRFRTILPVAEPGARKLG
jgi:hypothetical protein